ADGRRTLYALGLGLFGGSHVHSCIPQRVLFSSSASEVAVFRIEIRGRASDSSLRCGMVRGMAPFRAIMLPGSVLPGELAYGSLVAALGSGTEALVKELEVYATPEAPPDYTLDLEVGGVLRDADERGWERFHLVGYSGGGAAALAFAARHSKRLASLALLEPAWAGRWTLSPAE